MRKYVVNDAKNKKYKNVFGVTDYDIPMFGFKSALFICFMTLTTLLIFSNFTVFGFAWWLAPIRHHGSHLPPPRRNEYCHCH